MKYVKLKKLRGAGEGRIETFKSNQPRMLNRLVKSGDWELIEGTIKELPKKKRSCTNC